MTEEEFKSIVKPYKTLLDELLSANPNVDLKDFKTRFQLDDRRQELNRILKEE